MTDLNTLTGGEGSEQTSEVTTNVADFISSKGLPMMEEILGILIDIKQKSVYAQEGKSFDNNRTIQIRLDITRIKTMLETDGIPSSGQIINIQRDFLWTIVNVQTNFIEIARELKSDDSKLVYERLNDLYINLFSKNGSVDMVQLERQVNEDTELSKENKKIINILTTISENHLKIKKFALSDNLDTEYEAALAKSNDLICDLSVDFQSILDILIAIPEESRTNDLKSLITQFERDFDPKNNLGMQGLESLLILNREIERFIISEPLYKYALGLDDLLEINNHLETITAKFVSFYNSDIVSKEVAFFYEEAGIILRLMDEVPRKREATKSLLNRYFQSIMNDYNNKEIELIEIERKLEEERQTGRNNILIMGILASLGLFIGIPNIDMFQNSNMDLIASMTGLLSALTALAAYSSRLKQDRENFKK